MHVRVLGANKEPVRLVEVALLDRAASFAQQKIDIFSREAFLYLL
jgi:hypothetical protein